MAKLISKIIIILSILGLILPSFSFAQVSPQPGPPGTLEGVKITGREALKFIPETLKGVWQDILGFWLKIWNWLKHIWNSYIFPFLHNIWLKIKSPFEKEIRERKPIIEKEFQKEKEEMKEEIKTLPKITKSLWEKFKELIK